MAHTESSTVSTIDGRAALFCVKLTQACNEETDREFAKWSAADRVDNPDPLGRNDSARLRGQAPQRTFRYGMPSFQASRPLITFVVSRNLSSCFRTPAQQAAEVAAMPNPRSWVCWGAHMSNLARHVIPTTGGRSFTDGNAFERQLGEHLPWFVTIWEDTLRSCGLRDANGGQTWFKKDQLHIEVPGAKLPQTDPRATACVLEYVRLVNAGQGQRNLAFEQRCEPVLAVHLQGLDP